MSRQRILSPEFFTDERICSLPMADRLLFQGLWGLADREGRLPERPFELKIKILPVDTVNIPESLERIASKGLIIRYQVDGQNYIAVRNFLKFQKPHPREAPSILPEPEKGTAEQDLGLPKATPRSTQGTTKAFPSPAVSVSVSVPVSVSETVAVSAHETAQPPPSEPQPGGVLVFSRPTADPSGWLAEDFYAWAQFKRQEAGLVAERTRPRNLGGWYSTALMTLHGRTVALQEAFLRFGEDKYWQTKTPPLPFSGFVSQWEKYVPRGGANARS